MGYHTKEIDKGEYGELSKIREELDEAMDAESQGNRLMTLIELSDIICGIKGYLAKHFTGFKLTDLITMAEATERAFQSGDRK